MLPLQEQVESAARWAPRLIFWFPTNTRTLTMRSLSAICFPRARKRFVTSSKHRFLAWRDCICLAKGSMTRRSPSFSGAKCLFVRCCLSILRLSLMICQSTCTLLADVLSSSPFPKREFASPVEENVAIDALLPLLHSRRQQLIVRVSSSSWSDETQTGRVVQGHADKRIRRAERILQLRGIFIDESGGRVAASQRSVSDR